MGGIMSTLGSAAGALNVFDQEFNTIQNNITNANTPGYAAQNLALVAEPFSVTDGTTGGVMSDGLISTRSDYLEQNVRNQQTLLGASQQSATDLGQVQPLFDPTSTTGLSSSMSSFFNSFSALSVSPNDPTAEQQVITSAGQVAQSFNQVADGITQVSNGIATQTSSVVSQINQLASQIAGINQQYQDDNAATADPGLSAQMYSDLENLSQLANFSVVKASDGTYGVYLNGESPLVLGSQTYPISSSFSSGQTQILDSQGNDITSEITGGSLGGMLTDANTTLPGYLAQLNTLAQTFADQVNGQLAQGLDSSGSAPTENLFTYDQSGDAAATLAVNSSITPDQIAAASADAPGGNGNALAVAALASQNLVNGVTFTQAFANLSAQVGSDTANAQQNQTEDQDLVTQAQQQRQQVSGVSLDTEAAQMLQFQQSYQAVGQMVTVLNSLTSTLMDMVPLGSDT